MKHTSEYIDLIKAHADEIRTQFGVRTLRLPALSRVEAARRVKICQQYGL